MGPLVPSLHQVAGNIDSDNVCARASQWDSGGAVAAAEVENPHPRGDSKRIHHDFSGLAHEGGNLGKVTFFPQGLVWIDRSFCRGHMISLVGPHRLELLRAFRTTMVQLARRSVHT